VTVKRIVCELFLSLLYRWKIFDFPMIKVAPKVLVMQNFMISNN